MRLFNLILVSLFYIQSSFANIVSKFGEGDQIFIKFHSQFTESDSRGDDYVTFFKCIYDSRKDVNLPPLINNEYQNLNSMFMDDSNDCQLMFGGRNFKRSDFRKIPQFLKLAKAGARLEFATIFTAVGFAIGAMIESALSTALAKFFAGGVAGATLSGAVLYKQIVTVFVLSFLIVTALSEGNIKLAKGHFKVIINGLRATIKQILIDYFNYIPPHDWNNWEYEFATADYFKAVGQFKGHTKSTPWRIFYDKIGGENNELGITSDMIDDPPALLEQLSQLDCDPSEEHQYCQAFAFFQESLERVNLFSTEGSKIISDFRPSELERAFNQIFHKIDLAIVKDSIASYQIPSSSYIPFSNNKIPWDSEDKYSNDIVIPLKRGDFPGFREFKVPIDKFEADIKKKILVNIEKDIEVEKIIFLNIFTN